MVLIEKCIHLVYKSLDKCWQLGAYHLNFRIEISIDKHVEISQEEANNYVLHKNSQEHHQSFEEFEEALLKSLADCKMI
ncbi:MAG: hypothetical protein RSD53_01670 [Algoriella sp.]|uniref:hypothetical protein n=1 Tax=Algoriella sp. TaxID=1872434 RepID=UPI002FC89047